MTKIVVDTNIVFSALLKSNSIIGSLLLDSRDRFKFYSCKYLHKEIHNHLPKIRRLLRLDDNNLFELLHLIESNIFFIDEAFLPLSIIADAKELVRDVDFDDFAFVALALHLDALLWTGDKALMEGLKRKGYRKVINTAELQGLP